MSTLWEEFMEHYHPESGYVERVKLLEAFFHYVNGRAEDADRLMGFNREGRKA